MTMALDGARRLLFSTGNQALGEGHRPHSLADSSTAGLGIQGGKGALSIPPHTVSSPGCPKRGPDSQKDRQLEMIPKTSC